VLVLFKVKANFYFQNTSFSHWFSKYRLLLN